MKISVRDFLGNSYNHGNYIEIVNNIPSYTSGNIYKTLWKDKYETINNSIPDNISELAVIKWGIENNGIVIFVNYRG